MAQLKRAIAARPKRKLDTRRLTVPEAIKTGGIEIRGRMLDDILQDVVAWFETRKGGELSSEERLSKRKTVQNWLQEQGYRLDRENGYELKAEKRQRAPRSKRQRLQAKVDVKAEDTAEE
jgi:hypothetical protein